MTQELCSLFYDFLLILYFFFIKIISVIELLRDHVYVKKPQFFVTAISFCTIRHSNYLDYVGFRSFSFVHVQHNI